MTDDEYSHNYAANSRLQQKFYIVMVLLKLITSVTSLNLCVRSPSLGLSTQGLSALKNRHLSDKCPDVTESDG